MYKYKAIVTDVYDGDSITVDIDQGFGNWIHSAKIRLYGIDTPELAGSTQAEKDMAIAARDHLRELILEEEVTIETKKPKDKYGRYMAIISNGHICINDEMISSGHAREYFGGPKKGWI